MIRFFALLRMTGRVTFVWQKAYGAAVHDYSARLAAANQRGFARRGAADAAAIRRRGGKLASRSTGRARAAGARRALPMVPG